MHKLLAAIALAGALLAPAGTSAVALTPPPGLPCDSMSLEATMCGMQLDDDLTSCELGPDNQEAGCRAASFGRYGRCMNSC